MRAVLLGLLLLQLQLLQLLPLQVSYLLLLPLQPAAPAQTIAAAGLMHAVRVASFVQSSVVPGCARLDAGLWRGKWSATQCCSNCSHT